MRLFILSCVFTSYCTTATPVPVEAAEDIKSLVEWERAEDAGVVLLQVRQELFRKNGVVGDEAAGASGNSKQGSPALPMASLVDPKTSPEAKDIHEANPGDVSTLQQTAQLQEGSDNTDDELTERVGSLENAVTELRGNTTLLARLVMLIGSALSRGVSRSGHVSPCQRHLPGSSPEEGQDSMPMHPHIGTIGDNGAAGHDSLPMHPHIGTIGDSGGASGAGHVGDAGRGDSGSDIGTSGGGLGGPGHFGSGAGDMSASPKHTVIHTPGYGPKEEAKQTGGGRKDDSAGHKENSRNAKMGVDKGGPKEIGSNLKTTDVIGASNSSVSGTTTGTSKGAVTGVKELQSIGSGSGSGVERADGGIIKTIETSSFEKEKGLQDEIAELRTERAELRSEREDLSARVRRLEEQPVPLLNVPELADEKDTWMNMEDDMLALAQTMEKREVEPSPASAK